MIQRAAYEQEIKEQDAMKSDTDEETGLEVFEGDGLPTRTEDTKGNGKETAPPATTAADDDDAHITRNKRRRPVVDPFAGRFGLSST